MLSRLRNIGISAHIDSGKTTLAERMLFYCGRIHAMRDIRSRDGGPTMDSTPIEQRRGITIASAATRVEWNDHWINFVDTPGHVDFTVEVERSLRVLDGAILLLCSVGGVQSQTITVDRQMRRYGVPRIVFINKMDRAGANPSRVVEQLRTRLKMNAVPIQLAIGLEDCFQGSIDLVTMEAVYFDGVDGEVVRRTGVPEQWREQATLMRTEMLEALGWLDERLMEVLLSERQPEDAEIRRVIREATLTHRLTPVLLGSAARNKGVQEVLDAVVHYLPNPNEKEVYANDLQKVDPDGKPGIVRLSPSVDAPMVAMAFKTLMETHGQLTYLRIYQGRIEKGATCRNARTGRVVRFSRLVRMHANNLEEIEVAEAGDIVGVVGADCVSGDTFLGSGAECALENIFIAEPVLRISIAAERREDSDKLAKALERFRREDPTFHVSNDSITGETLIAGMGRLHLEVYIERIETEYACPCRIGAPHVAYKESPTVAVDFDYTLKKQTGGPGRFGRVIGRLEPLREASATEPENGFVFENQVRGGRIPQEYIASIERGFREQLTLGPLAQNEVVGVRILLKDGDFHEKDSSDMAFQMCARNALREVVYPHARFVLLEPIMKLEIETLQQYQGTVAGHLARIRGEVTAVAHRQDRCVIEAEVPLAETFNYADELRTMTQGDGTFTMEFLTYRATPTSVQHRVLATG